MATAPTSTRPGTVDPETGRFVSMSDDERKARTQAIARVFSQLTPADETETDEAWSEVLRGIDETRPHRPLFEGMY
ncbi:hypothetical protein SAMN05444166_2157 [Singulisphaera sp. GP187]|uniref:hypothetical protein n=1 Tax=Singulisphaera sp. GP187 TaxID=1882752 RepID=UPI00092C89F7|nr:hypothetical protein [Singulisphaera sp. GP187]SIO03987.1 hypothetical protein SAMN05444166_2157 [Singulisphaera sp. GP187]